MIVEHARGWYTTTSYYDKFDINFMSPCPRKFTELLFLLFRM